MTDIDTKQWNHESGSSLIAVMMSVGLLMIFVTTNFKAWVGVKQSAKLVTETQSYQEINKALLKHIETVLSSATSCPNPNSFNLALNNSFTNVSIQATTDVLAGVDSLTKSSATTHTQVGDAVERCETPTTISNPSSPGQSVIRFCYKPTNATSAAKTSSVLSPGSFSEIAVYFKESQSGANAACNGFISGNYAIAHIYLTHYWPVRINDKVNYRIRNSVALTRGVP